MADGLNTYPQPASVFANFPSLSQVNAMQPATSSQQPAPAPPPPQAPAPSQPQPASAAPFANFPSPAEVDVMTRRPSENDVMQMLQSIPNKTDRAVRGIGMGMTPMVSQDNTQSKLIPPSQVDQATQQGFLPAILMTSPDGKTHLVAHDQMQEAVGRGWQPGQPTQKDISQVTDESDPRYGSNEWYMARMSQPVVDGLNWLNQHYFAPKERFFQKVEDVAGQVAERTAATAVTDPFGSAPLTMQQLQQFRQEHPGIAGISRGVGKFGGQMLDPTMWPLLFSGGALPTVMKLADLGFSTQMLYGAYKTYPQIKEAADRGDTEGVWELLTNLGLSGYFGAKGLKTGFGVKDVPVSRLLDPLSNMTPGQIAVRATKPSVGIRDASARVETALPYAASAADKLGIDTENMGKDPDNPQSHTDALTATREAKTDVWDTLQDNHLAPAGTFIRDVNPVADAIDDIGDRMDPIERRRNPDLYQKIRDAANDYRDQQVSVQYIEKRIEKLNNSLSSELSQRKVKQDTLRNDPAYGYQFAELESLRSELNDALDSLTGPGAQHLKNVYGSLKTLEGILESSRGVAERASPMGLFKGLGRMSGVGNLLGGLYDVGTSPFSESAGKKIWEGGKQALTGLGQIWYGKQMQKLNDRNFLLGEAFRRSNRATLPGRQWTTPPVPPAPPASPAAAPPAAPQLGLPPGQYAQPPSTLPPQGALPSGPAGPPALAPATPPGTPQLNRGPIQMPPSPLGANAGQQQYMPTPAPPPGPPVAPSEVVQPRMLGPARLPTSISGPREAAEAAAARGANLPAWAALGQPRPEAAPQATGAPAEAAPLYTKGETGNEPQGPTGQQDPREQQRAAAEDQLRARVSRGTDTGRAGDLPYTYTRKGGGDATRLRSTLGVPVLESWSLNPETAATLRSKGFQSPDIHELDYNHPAAAQTFRDQIAKTKVGNRYAASVHVYTPEEYSQARLFLSEDGKAGFALKPDGDIISVFTHGDGPKGAVHTMLEIAKQAGGSKLDAFDTILPKIYGNHGFTAVARLPWNDEFIPEGWDKKTYAEFNNGEPDVVFMARNPDALPYRAGDGARVADYDEATRLQQQAQQRMTRK